MFLEKPLHSGGRGKSTVEKATQGLEDCSVVLEVSHPFRPIVRLAPACFCPGAACVELSVPLACPQLLDPDFSYGEIQKDHICCPIVPVTRSWRRLIRICLGEFPIRLWFGRVDRLSIAVWERSIRWSSRRPSSNTWGAVTNEPAPLVSGSPLSRLVECQD